MDSPPDTLPEELKSFQMYQRFEKPIQDYMRFQTEINTEDRINTICWILEIHNIFHGHSETFFLAINIMDRFFSKKIIERDNIKIVGAAAWFIASKMEEETDLSTPNLDVFCQTLNDNEICKEDLIYVDRIILETINYQLYISTIFQFTQCLCNLNEMKEISQNKKFQDLLETLSIRCLCTYSLMKFPHSKLACSIFLTVLEILKIEPLFKNKQIPKFLKENSIDCNLLHYLNNLIYK